MAERPLDVAVIGAGIGGLSAAVRLAAAGKRVAVFEKNAAVGGKMSRLAQDGFQWDTGPSVITMRHVFEDLFAAAGRRLADYLTLLPVDPLTRYFYPDGTRLDATQDPQRMAAQIATLNPDDVAGYRAFLAYAAEIHRITGPVFIYDTPPTPRSFTRVPLRDMLRVDAWRTMAQAIDSHVTSPELRQLLGRFATYVGGSPYRAPATLNVIADVELSGGVWYPQGGVYTIATALQRLAEELGVAIHTGHGVARIRVEAGRARGLILEDGTSIAAAAVVANVDVADVYARLLPPEIATPARVRAATRREPSCSGFIMMLGIAGSTPALAHHNIFFSSAYRREFADIFERGVPPEEPTVYVAITSKTDPGHAPAGHENWFVLVNAPALDKRYDWIAGRDAYRARVLDTLARFGHTLTGRIVSETIWTPLEIRDLSAAWRGALYGASPNSRWAAFRRPHNRSRDVAGLYFAGGTTHPGGGVPMVALSGAVAARLLCEDFPD